MAFAIKHHKESSTPREIKVRACIFNKFRRRHSQLITSHLLTRRQEVSVEGSPLCSKVPLGFPAAGYERGVFAVTVATEAGVCFDTSAAAVITMVMWTPPPLSLSLENRRSRRH